MHPTRICAVFVIERLSTDCMQHRNLATYSWYNITWTRHENCVGATPTFGRRRRRGGCAQLYAQPCTPTSVKLTVARTRTVVQLSVYLYIITERMVTGAAGTGSCQVSGLSGHLGRWNCPRSCRCVGELCRAGHCAAWLFTVVIHRC